MWFISVERFKASSKKTYMCERAVEMLRGLPRARGQALRPPDHVSDYFKRMGRDDITVHGFRSTFREIGQPNDRLAAR